MMFGEYHVFHYIGHGGLDQNTGEGLLVLTGPDGRARLATGAELYVMLANSPVRLAVLNSCQGARISAIDPYAGAAASLVHQGIPAVVAMQFEISDDAAIAFSRTLYEAISYGWPVDAAVAEARRAILAASRAEWATPVLYLRAADGVLLNTPPPTRTPAPPQPTGLTGSTTDRDVTLQWAPSPAGLSTVPRWEVRRDGTAVTEVTEPHATDQPPPGSHEYTVVAIGTDGQRSTESAAWMAVIPDISSRPPVVPTGLRGSSSKGYVELHWDTTEPDSPPVRHWEVFRDGALVTEAVSPRAGDKPPRPGVYVYTAVALGEDGQRSGESIPWTAVVSPPEAPLPPSRLTGISTAGRVDLRWEPAIAHSVGVVRWQIFRDRAPVGEATSTYARDVPHRPGFYQYTVLAIGEDGQRSAQSVPCTVEVVAGGRPRWLVPAVALSALILATAGLLVWAPWQASSAPLPPAGLTGEVSGTTIQLRWQPAPAGLAAVRRWEVRRDGVLIGKATEPRWAGSVPGPGLYAYTVVAFGEDGQQSVESDSWTSPPAWVKMTDTGFQQSFTAAGVASYNGELWIVGGFGADSLPREEVRRFNPKSEKWLSGPSLPIGIHHGALVSTDDQLFLLGGVAGSDLVPTNIVYRLNDPNGEWVEVEDAPLRAPRYAGSAAWDGQRLVFAGGAEQLCRNCPRPAMGDVWALENQLWVDVDQLTQPRAHLRAVVDDGGTISFVGGADVSKGRVFADVDVLRDDTVERGTPMSTALEGMAAIWTSDTGICTFGGSTSLPNDIPQPVAAVNCSDGPDWPDLPKARMFVGAAVIGDTVYIVGGHPNLDVSDMVLALRFR
jgi:N-acetylneuraminic acid mutarotase